jgi:hypothetical protein
VLKLFNNIFWKKVEESMWDAIPNETSHWTEQEIESTSHDVHFSVVRSWRR